MFTICKYQGCYYSNVIENIIYQYTGDTYMIGFQVQGKITFPKLYIKCLKNLH